MRRLLTSGGCVAILGVLATLTLSSQGSGQSSVAATAPPLVVTAFNGGPEPAGWASPKTPWGEPDLQGVWSSDDATFPVSRGGRGGAAPTGLYLNDEQWAARQKQIQQGVATGENAIGAFRGDFARRAFRQTSYVVDPPDGVQPQPLPAARARARLGDRGTFGDGPFNTFDDFTNYDRCITRGIWGSVIRVIYGNGNRIVQAPGMVVLSYEMLPDTRILYTDGRPRLNSSMHQYLGDARARWEGEELVVETTNLTDKTAIGVNGNGVRHSTQMVITERFRRVADGIIQYQATYDDPVTYDKPFTVSFPLTPLDGGQLLPYDCHPGNTAISMSLSAERAEDRAVAADAAKGIVRPRRTVQDDGAGVGAAPPAGRGGGRGAGAPPLPAGAATGERDVER